MKLHKSTKILLVEAGAIALGGALLAPVSLGHALPLPLPYNWHKTLHVLGAVLFLGNIVVTGFWMLAAERTRRPEVIRFAAVWVNWADVAFTAPGIFLLLTNGILLSQTWGGPYGTIWITAALALFTLSGAIWAVSLIPVQDRLARMAETSGELPAEFFALLRRWYIWGAIATLLPLGSLALMIVKPG